VFAGGQNAGLVLVFVKITDDQRERFGSHFVVQGQSRTLPPLRVYLAVASLVSDPEHIKASLRSFQPGPPTVWRIHLLTDTALAVVTIQFEVGGYTCQEENHRGLATPSPPYELTEAWIRPLDKITSYSTTDVRSIPQTDWFEVTTRLTFRGSDAPVDLPLASMTSAPAEQKRSDDFLKALRESVEWLA
jgi:hypothetical protein